MRLVSTETRRQRSAALSPKCMQITWLIDLPQRDLDMQYTAARDGRIGSST